MSSEKSTSETMIFISYASEDAESAKKVAQQLRLAGMNVWIDSDSLLPGQRWRSEIRRAIQEARYFLALLSSKSISKRGYVQKELREALAILDTIPESEIYILPCRLDHCTPSDSELRNLHWVDLFPSWQDGMKKVFRALGIDEIAENQQTTKKPEREDSPSSHTRTTDNDLGSMELEVLVSDFLALASYVSMQEELVELWALRDHIEQRLENIDRPDLVRIIIESGIQEDRVLTWYSFELLCKLTQRKQHADVIRQEVSKRVFGLDTHARFWALILLHIVAPSIYTKTDLESEYSLHGTDIYLYINFYGQVTGLPINPDKSRHREDLYGPFYGNDFERFYKNRVALTPELKAEK